MAEGLSAAGFSPPCADADGFATPRAVPPRAAIGATNGAFAGTCLPSA
jgi:hypothetical protein